LINKIYVNIEQLLPERRTYYSLRLTKIKVRNKLKKNGGVSFQYRTTVLHARVVIESIIYLIVS
jgi:hypothetical protein